MKLVDGKVDLSDFKIDESQLKKILGGLTEGSTEIEAQTDDSGNCGLFCSSCLGCTASCTSCTSCTMCKRVMFIAATPQGV